MDRNAVVAALAPALLLYACERAVLPAEDGRSFDTPTRIPGAAERPGAANTAAPQAVVPTVARDAGGVNDGIPDLTPATLGGEAERGIKGARNVLLSFARAIELKEFDQAWAVLGAGDRQKWTKAEFARNFAGLDAIAVAIPDGTTDGAAGSIYYLAPITISATNEAGRPVRFEGETVLKRVNDIDGATPEQLRWRFDRLTLDWTH